MADQVNERMVRRERKAFDKAVQTPSDTRAMTGNPHPDLEQPDPRTLEAHEAELERQDMADIKEPGDAYVLAHTQQIAPEDEGKQKYVVQGGGIAVKKGRPNKPGDVVALSDADARKFSKKGRLRPFFEDPMDDPVVQAYAERSGMRRQSNTVTTDRDEQTKASAPKSSSTSSKATTTSKTNDNDNGDEKK